ncbi:LLM class flavin-dependent oxidoreductase [Streptomyces sp. ME02-8801-2C]|uniref:LLM class flavin-dependent oxidoreductase n=1 Tax=Streptomyces sp. ME02-8801-2C TaxID=3028680 RepID=UPI0029BE22E2|nr:LLM class flavin-dependent oxidoreductase [Streptomyces sp. ME02-8801-2C]MDX3454809.1 LLM class flavin-dependent oxidoreductase [Streptomyces sp. ME02-8801-2C]
MTSTHGRGLLHLAVAAADQQELFDADLCVESARLAESGGLDFVTFGPDALGVLARVAPATTRIGLVPTVSATRTEARHVRAAVANLDRVSGGRAGWQLDVSATGAEAGLSGRRRAVPGDELWREAGEVADAAARLWDDPEDGDEMGEVVPGGFGDRDAPRHIGARLPQGHPVRVVDATGVQARQTAARYADVALVRAASVAQAGAVRDELRVAAKDLGRDPDGLRVLASLVVDLGGGEYAAEPGHGGGGPRPSAHGPLYRGGPVDLAELITAWHTSGAVDGFHLVPAEPRRDLERLVNGTVALLQHRCLFRTFYPGRTLREHLGLARPARQYTGSVGSAGGAA